MRLSYEQALDQYEVGAGKGIEVDADLLELYACDVLGLTPLEYGRLDPYTLRMHLAFREGKALGEWLTTRQAKGSPRGS